ncbi:hypothetical protein PHLGIDRAFT_26261 [Phlebiopsis gigantea 11061_1 CR5-6]|uniref:Cytochrome P450 n=1 Tax=Phlebiopsis gigantea (strain 11061_1 CR5-6) TaxID=745531 RepID=A0A0C3S1H8_PHLG1|nr:hypothetical protein PHLGIDRAFT_26261 [Phlebiopsis gigantea 11061_1 CR5-6]
MNISTIIVGAICIGAAFFILARQKSRNLPHPPGPQGYPLVGYLKTIPSPLWKTYLDWGRQYKSDIVRLNILGNNMIVTNTLKATLDLLDKRSAIHSDSVGFGWSTASAPYGQYWRESRKLFQKTFGPHAVGRYRPVETTATHKLLRNLLETPKDFRKHIRYLFGSLAIEVAYGLEVDTGEDSLIATAEAAMWAANQCMTPGAYLVDLIPILKYVPAWFPGAQFKREAREWKKTVDAMANVPYEAIKSTTALDTFFLAMTLYPEVQRKAQESIDRVCQGRLPEFSDLHSLTYVQALVKECLRCYTVAPYGMPHMVTTDDIYNGYYIPAGSTIIANIWAILHDTESYPEPERFDPDRFLRQRDGGGVELNPDVLDPSVAAFGFGRRICPGRHLAYESLWLSMASILAVFNIRKAVSSQGQPITPAVDFTETFISSPKDFQCVIRPRTSENEA